MRELCKGFLLDSMAIAGGDMSITLNALLLDCYNLPVVFYVALLDLWTPSRACQKRQGFDSVTPQTTHENKGLLEQLSFFASLRISHSISP